MTPSRGTAQALRRKSGIRPRKLKGWLFEGVLLATTFVGVIALLVLFGFIFFDAFRPLTASLGWYLIVAGTVVLPVSLFTLYSRRRPAVRIANAKAGAAVFGGLAVSLAAFVVLEAISPYGVLVYLVTAGLPAVLIAGYGWYADDTMFVGPAMLAAVLLGIVWTFGSEVIVVPLHDVVFAVAALLFGWIPVLGAVPIPVDRPILVTAVTVGLPTITVAVSTLRWRRYAIGAVVVPATLGISVVGTIGFDRLIRPPLEILAPWLAYVGVVGLPVACLCGIVVGRRETVQRGGVAASLVVAGTLVVGGLGIVLSVDPSLPVVLFSCLVVPTLLVVRDVVRTADEGRIGLVGPFVLVGGLLAGVGLEGVLAATGPNSWVSPTILMNTWNGIDPSRAGAYPSIVGSIMIVSVMALLAFPVGIGAAIYLEEYAPETGWAGGLADLLEINISNLAGVPSVVYGLLGLAIFNNALDFDPGLVLSAAATLGLLILPIVIVSAQEAIRSVPDALREASYGMGASRWQTLREVVLPEAIPGILTGTILALGRAIGETAPLIIIAVPTTTFTAPDGLLSSGAALPLKIFSASANAIPAYRKGVVAALAVVLLVLMLTMNAVAIVIRNRYQRNP